MEKSSLELFRPFDPKAFYVYSHVTEEGSESYVYSIDDNEEDAKYFASELNEFHSKSLANGNPGKFHVSRGSELAMKFNIINKYPSINEDSFKKDDVISISGLKKPLNKFNKTFKISKVTKNNES